MLGLFRNTFRFSNTTANLLKFSQVSSSNGAVSKSTCQQCSNTLNSNSVTPTLVQVPTRCFGTLRALVSPATWKLENYGNSNGFLKGGTQSCEVQDEAEHSIISSGAYFVQARGMKYKGVVKRRCKDCFLKWINGMLYNLCKTHPRHKHGLKPAYFANQRILTHATMSPKRPW